MPLWPFLLNLNGEAKAVPFMSSGIAFSLYFIERRFRVSQVSRWDGAPEAENVQHARLALGANCGGSWARRAKMLRPPSHQAAPKIPDMPTRLVRTQCRAKTHCREAVEKLAAGENGIFQTMLVVLAGLLNHNNYELLML